MANFTITPVGLPIDQSALLGTVIELLSGIEIGDWKLVSDPLLADVVLIDLETERGDAYFKDHQASESEQLLALKTLEATEVWQTNVRLPPAAGFHYFSGLLRELERTLLQRRVVGQPRKPAPVVTAPVTRSETKEKSSTTVEIPLVLDATPVEYVPLVETDDADDIVGQKVATLEIAQDSLGLQPSTGLGVAASLTVDSRPDNSNIIEFPRIIVAAPAERVIDSELSFDSDVSVTNTTDEAERLSTAPNEDARALDDGNDANLDIDVLLDTGSEADTVSKPIIRSMKKFYPATCLLGHIQSILHSGAPASINHPSYPEIFIHPAEGLFATSLGQALPLEMFAEPFFEFQVSGSNWKRRPKGNDQPVWILLYLAAFHAANGRLVSTARLEEPFILKRFPRLERVDAGDSELAMKLASSLAEEESNLSHLLIQLECSLSELATLVSAWITVGFITQPGIEPQPWVQAEFSEDKPTRKKGLLARLRNSFGHAKG